MSTKIYFDSKTRDALSKKFGSRVLFDENLATHVAYGVGGPADALVFPKVAEELIWIADLAKEKKIPLTIIGTGTNLLVRDEGIRGITLSLAQAFKEIEYISDKLDPKPLIRVGGGVPKPELLNWAIKEGLTGLEFSAGVPGTIGGGIYMNAGTKYGSYGDILKKLTLFDFKSGIKIFNREELHFGYREQNAVGNNLVIETIFQLQRGDKQTIQTEVDRIILERAEKQPLDYPSCGSTFKNPEGHSAGRLIEKTGLKGTTIGGAQISLKHANFILNKGNAKAQDILDLIQIVKERVWEQFGVKLENEVIVVGGNELAGQISNTH